MRPSELDLKSIERSILDGLPKAQDQLHDAFTNSSYYGGDGPSLVPRRYQETAERYALLPKVGVNLVKLIVDVLATSYENPPTRQLDAGAGVQAWVDRVYAANHVNTLLREADRLSTLNDCVLLQAAVPGEEDAAEDGKEIRVWLWSREEFWAWPRPDDPTALGAVVTIEPNAVLGETKYTLWTETDYYVYKTYGESRSARFFEGQAHGYGCLPFTLISYELPVRSLWVSGLGSGVREANAGIDRARSELENSVWYFGDPIGIITGASEELASIQRTPGSWNKLSPAVETAAGTGETPTASYLQPKLDIEGRWVHINNSIDQVLTDHGVPKSAVRMEQSGTASGVALVSEQIPLLKRERGRQKLWKVYESRLKKLVLTVAGNGLGRPDLLAAADAELSLLWPDPSLGLPDPAVQAEVQGALDRGELSLLQLLQRKNGFTRKQALGWVKQVLEDEVEVMSLREQFSPTTVLPSAVPVPVVALPGVEPNLPVSENPPVLGSWWVIPMADVSSEIDPVAAAKAEAKSYRLKLRKAKELLAKAEKERDDLKTNPPSKEAPAPADTGLQAKYDDLARERDELRGKVRERVHADAFRALHDDPDFGGDQVWKRMPTQKLWALAGYSPDDDEPDLGSLKDLLSGLKESDPYLFTPVPSGAGGQGASPEVKSPRPPGAWCVAGCSRRRFGEDGGVAW